jgi:O-antigen ligase
MAAGSRKKPILLHRFAPKRIISLTATRLFPMTRTATRLIDRADRAFAWLATAGLVLFPALMFYCPTQANVSFGVVVGVAVLALVRRARFAEVDVLSFLRRYWPLLLAMASISFAVAIQSAAASGGWPRVSYLYLRFVLFAPLMWLLILLGTRRIAWVTWGLAIGTVVAAMWMHQVVGVVRLQHIGLFNAVPFGNLSLMMGVLLLLSIGWNRPGDRLQIALKVICGAAGLYASVLTGTRGGWLALPAFVVVMLFVPGSLGRLVKIGIFAVVIGAIVAGGLASDRIAQRVEEAVVGVTEFDTGKNLDTSEGLRLQVWGASLRIFQSHPVLGIGAERFPEALKAIGAAHVITPLATESAHSHNDILFAMATLGIPGLLAILATYLVPAIFFMRHLRHRDLALRTAAAMGLALCAGFAVFGLTEAMFVIALTNAFYSLMMAAFAAYVVRRKIALDGWQPAQRLH